MKEIRTNSNLDMVTFSFELKHSITIFGIMLCDSFDKNPDDPIQTYQPDDSHTYGGIILLKWKPNQCGVVDHLLPKKSQRDAEIV